MVFVPTQKMITRFRPANQPEKIIEGTVLGYSFPGFYPLFWLTADNGVLCVKCVNKNKKLINNAPRNNDKQWLIVDEQINFECKDLYCNNCEKQIESAYGDD